MATSIRLFLLVLVAVALLTTHASATLVKVTDPTSPGGADNVTHDTATGLYWLDWTASQNIRFSAMNRMLGTGGAYGRWRHATIGEVFTLANSVGLPTANFPFNSIAIDSGASYDALSTFVGVSQEGAGPSRTSYAITGTAGGSPSLRSVFQAYTLPKLNSSETVGFFAPVGESYPTVGHALVRTSLAVVPEPIGIALIGAIVSSWLMTTVGRRRRG